MEDRHKSLEKDKELLKKHGIHVLDDTCDIYGYETVLKSGLFFFCV